MKQVVSAGRIFLQWGCILLFVCGSGIPALAQTCVTPPPGIIAWWPLDETKGTIAADIGGSHPGVYFDGPRPAAGKVGGSLRFDGTGAFVGVGDSDLWAFGTRDFTIELWANFDAPGGGSIGPSWRHLYWQ